LTAADKGTVLLERLTQYCSIISQKNGIHVM